MSLEPITRVEKMLDAIAKGTPTDLSPITREEMFLAKAGGASVSVPEPTTRKEMFLSKMAGGTPELPKPITREEIFLAKAGGMDIATPEPVTRKEIFLSEISTGGEYSEGLAYTLSEDGTYYSVSGIGTCTDTDIVIPPEYEGKPVKAIGHAAFASPGITSVHIPDSVTSIGESAFWGCTDLTSITIPGSVTYIGISAFRFCAGLASITIPDSVTYIGISAFRSCTGLTSITIPGSVATIEDYVFWGCTGVRFYDFTSHTSVPTLRGKSAFEGIPADCEIRVPAALYEEWKAATNWSAYADHIVGVGAAIPPEYQQVEYIESTGTQYINTGHVVKSNYLEIKSKIFASVKNTEMAVFGSDKTLEAGFSSTRNRMFVYASNGAKSLGGIFDNIYDNIIDFNAKFYPSGRTVSVNDETVSDDINHNLTGEVIKLFSYYGSSYRLKGRVYNFKIYDDNALARDLVPCYRKSDQVIGMYDLVSKTFFTNQGTGNFTADAEVAAEEAMAELREDAETEE